MGLLGGLLGGGLGLLGAMLGTWLSIRNTKGPKERSFMIKVSVATWFVVTLMLVAVVFLRYPRAFWLMVPFFLVLPFAIGFTNKRQLKLRQEESE